MMEPSHLTEKSYESLSKSDESTSADPMKFSSPTKVPLSPMTSFGGKDLGQ